MWCRETSARGLLTRAVFYLFEMHRIIKIFPNLFCSSNTHPHTSNDIYSHTSRVNKHLSMQAKQNNRGIQYADWNNYKPALAGVFLFVFSHELSAFSRGRLYIHVWNTGDRRLRCETLGGVRCHTCVMFKSTEIIKQQELRTRCDWLRTTPLKIRLFEERSTYCRRNIAHRARNNIKRRARPRSILKRKACENRFQSMFTRMMAGMVHA